MSDHSVSDISGARSMALDLLEDIFKRKKPLEEAFNHKKGLEKLTERDRQFVRLLITTTLRHLGEIDHAIGQFLEKPLPARAAMARDILRLGAAQSLFLHTPAYAVVDNMVHLAGQRPDSRGFKALINAVLRKITSSQDLLSRLQAEGAVSLPDWLWQSWTKAYGLEHAKRIALAHLKEPPLDFSVKSEPAIWAERLHAVVLPTGTLRLVDRNAHPSRIEEFPGFREGGWWVQDLAASLPVKMAGSLAGKKVLDICAAPGGKTAQLIAAGAEVTALERAHGRMERLKQNLSRLKLKADFQLSDANFWNGPQDFDFVLLDAPCSATGTIRRHPDVAWSKEPREIGSLIQAQAALLESACKQVKAGGLLIYCVCSLQPEEGEAQIEQFLRNHPEMSRQPLQAEELPGIPAINKQGDLRTFPDLLSERGGMDGFYAARLRKNG